MQISERKFPFLIKEMESIVSHYNWEAENTGRIYRNGVKRTREERQLDSLGPHRCRERTASAGR